jgi:hypothetical protein
MLIENSSNNRKLLILVILIFFYACSLKQKEINIPKYVISADSMAQILADVYIQETMINLHNQQGQHMKMNPEKQYQLIFHKYNISKEQYDSSYQFYLDNPALLNKIYENIIIELSKKQAEIEQGKSFDTSVSQIN